MVVVPWDVSEIVKAGGVDGLARRAAAEARREVWEEALAVYEATLAAVEKDEEAGTAGDLLRYVHLVIVIRSLRRRLGIPVPAEVKRAQTRERVRRYRERQGSREPG